MRDDSLTCDDAVHNIMGSTMRAPFLIASSVGLVAVPDLGHTELGLVDCKTQGLMNVVLSDEQGESHVQSSLSTAKRVKICCRCPSHAHNIHRMMDFSILELSAQPPLN